ncbi:scarecrow-like protein 14 [Prunus yedoensis var. nudiflora]|uniref:Scarecrow-like protein 14 n=1 Tax=Prunus yedoensis var. nudiflora TaxID=2094558 RepID=A0A314UQS4_PRUYE|nr:scarecrow-like protein 14 [Prunus yedoensis var. nudiflora]
MNRLRHIPDETVMVNSPRDIVLKLIKKINPDLFFHGVVNGTYNSPFFVTRFREALFHFSALFDVFEASVPREDERRLMFEKYVYGKEILNVVACEGLERVERPETYKQWQVRNVRAGFKQLPLDQEILKKVKRMLKFMGYHNDFRIDEGPLDSAGMERKNHYGSFLLEKSLDHYKIFSLFALEFFL